MAFIRKCEDGYGVYQGNSGILLSLWSDEAAARAEMRALHRENDPEQKHRGVEASEDFEKGCKSKLEKENPLLEPVILTKRNQAENWLRDLMQYRLPYPLKKTDESLKVGKRLYGAKMINEILAEFVKDDFAEKVKGGWKWTMIVAEEFKKKPEPEAQSLKPKRNPRPPIWQNKTFIATKGIGGVIYFGYQNPPGEFKTKKAKRAHGRKLYDNFGLFLKKFNLKADESLSVQRKSAYETGGVKKLKARAKRTSTLPNPCAVKDRPQTVAKNPTFRKKRKGAYVEHYGMSQRGLQALDRGLKTPEMISDEFGVNKTAISHVLDSEEWHHATDKRGIVRELDFYESPSKDEVRRMKLYPKLKRKLTLAEKAYHEKVLKGTHTEKEMFKLADMREEIENLKYEDEENKNARKNPAAAKMTNEVAAAKVFKHFTGSAPKKALKCQRMPKRTIYINLATGYRLGFETDLHGGPATEPPTVHITSRKIAWDLENNAIIIPYPELKKVIGKDFGKKYNKDVREFTKGDERAAIKLYKKFRGYDPESITIETVDNNSMLIETGKATFIKYRSDKYGGNANQLYKHNFNDCTMYVDLANYSIVVTGPHLEITKHGIEG